MEQNINKEINRLKGLCYFYMFTTLMFLSTTIVFYFAWRDIINFVNGL